MKKIKLGKSNKYALIDDEDFEKINSSKWHLNSFGYPIKEVRKEGKRIGELFMHRFILGLEKSNGNNLTDHINRNRLDNRKINLRIVNRKQNSYNRNSLKKFRGVYKNCFIKNHIKKFTKSWNAQITFQNKAYYLGSFNSEKNAAIAYNQAAKKFFGEYAVLNSI